MFEKLEIKLFWRVKWRTPDIVEVVKNAQKSIKKHLKFGIDNLTYLC